MNMVNVPVFKFVQVYQKITHSRIQGDFALFVPGFFPFKGSIHESMLFIDDSRCHCVYHFPGNGAFLGHQKHLAR